MPEHKFDLSLLTQIGEPIPAEQRLTADDQLLSERFDRFEEVRRFGGEIVMEAFGPIGIDHAEVHTSCVQVHSAVKFTF